MAMSLTGRRLTILAAGSALALAMTGAVSAIGAPTGDGGGADPNTDAAHGPAGAERDSAIVRLSGEPLTTRVATAPARGRQLDFSSRVMSSERAQLAAQRNDFKRWMRANAPAAQVTGEYDIALNAVAVRLNGTSLTTLRSAPGVRSAGYQTTYTSTAEDPDLARIDALAGWAAANPPGGPENAGTGVQVAVVDTGIDTTHPCFDDAGFPATPQRGDRRFTNNKVIVAKVFSNKAANLGYSPEAVQDHGTHVAGTVACNATTPAMVDGADIPYDPSGVAPGAQLGNYNVFPGDIVDARTEDILNALQAAARDGMDVVNMSLGGGAHGLQDLLTIAVDNLDRANIVVAVSAGNSGPGHYTVESPGSADRALTAGASSVGHFVGTPITAGGAIVTVAAAGDFPIPDADLTAGLAASAGDPLGIGCVDNTYTDADGMIALVSRGTCSFGNKVALAEKAGAVGVVVVNNLPGDPTAMGEDPAFTTTIPAVMVGLTARDSLLALAGPQGGQDVTIGSDLAYVETGNHDVMGSFSSQGPTDVDFRVKPDLVAPGVNVLSSIPAAFCADPTPLGCWAFFQGTSMASPHLAGTAAVVRQAHPAWSASEVRSAITNTAKEGVLTKSTDLTAPETDVQVIGAGLADVDAAVGASVALSSVSTSFGAVPSGSSRSVSRQVSVTNLTAAPLTLPVSVTGNSAFGVSTASLALPVGGTGTLTLTFRVAAAAPATQDQQATLRLGGVAHSALYAFVR